MFKCRRCKCEFEELPKTAENHPYGDGYAVEYIDDDICPVCGGDLEEQEEE